MAHAAGLLLVLTLGGLGPLAAPANADSVAPLGATGQWLLGGSAGGTYETRSTRNHEGPPVSYDMNHLSLWLSPSVLHFVATDFAVGVSLLVGRDHYARSDGVDLYELRFGGGAQLAYRAGLGAHAFLLPRLSIGGTQLEKWASPPEGGFSNSGADAFERYRWVPFRDAYYEGLVSEPTALYATLSLPLAFSPAAGLYLGSRPVRDGALRADRHPRARRTRLGPVTRRRDHDRHLAVGHTFLR
jgi:hypothetical protein